MEWKKVMKVSHKMKSRDKNKIHLHLSIVKWQKREEIKINTVLKIPVRYEPKISEVDQPNTGTVGTDHAL